jgi:hypothetical protein
MGKLPSIRGGKVQHTFLFTVLAPPKHLYPIEDGGGFHLWMPRTYERHKSPERSHFKLPEASLTKDSKPPVFRRYAEVKIETEVIPGPQRILMENTFRLELDYRSIMHIKVKVPSN